MLQLDAFATIASPVRSAGLLTAIAVTMHQHRHRRSLERYIDRLESKQAHARVIQQATQVVMATRGVDETEAYKLLRSKAMLQRASIESIANTLIVKARAALKLLTPRASMAAPAWRGRAPRVRTDRNAWSRVIGSSGPPRAVALARSERGTDARSGRCGILPMRSSTAAAQRNTVGSSKGRPAICSPMGRPSSSNPQGTEIAGSPVRLNG